MDKVMLHWADLPGNAFKVLLVMAKTGMDADVEPTYRGGWVRLAMTGLGRRDWPADDDMSPEAERVRKALFELVRRAIRDAKTAGAIRVKRQGKRGSVAHYTLHLDRPMGQLPNKTLGSDTTKGCGLPNKTLGTTQRNVGAKETREPMETTGEISSSTAVPHQAPKSPPVKTRKAHHLQSVRDRCDADNEKAS
jgi:hypothetical protein